MAAPPSAAGAHVVMRRVVQPQPRTWRLRFRHARAGGQHASEAPLLASVLRCPESGLGALTCGASVGPRPPDAARSFGPCSRTCRRRRRPRSSLPPGREGDGDGGGGGGALAAPCHGGRVRGPRALWEAPCGLLSFGGGGGAGRSNLASRASSPLSCLALSVPLHVRGRNFRTSGRSPATRDGEHRPRHRSRLARVRAGRWSGAAA